MSKTKRITTLGFWSAITAAALTVIFAILSIVFTPEEWSDMASYANSFASIQMASFIPVLFLTPTMVLLMVCIHYHAPEDKRVLSLTAIAFTTIYATLICTNYYLQLFVVRLNILSGDLEGLSLLAMPNLHSAFFAFESIGYAFLSLATLVITPIFTEGALENWIRWLLIIAGALGLFGVVVAPFDQPTLIFAGLGLWSLLFPIAMVLVGFFFRRTQEGTKTQSNLRR
jgi:hypothetical protein